MANKTEPDSRQNSFTRIEGSRIAFYLGESLSNGNFWDNHWQAFQAIPPDKFYAPYTRGYIGYGTLASAFLKYLPKEGVVLEAGCGLSQYVVALRARGYNCCGIDYAEETVSKVKTIFPDLPVAKGDILALPYQNEFLNAYISLGVVEHFREGPAAAIREAHRVLRKGAIAIISVPQAYKWRKEQVNPEGVPVPAGLNFYQYAYPPEEFRQILIEEGFSVLSEYGYSSHYALGLRFPWVKRLFSAFPKLSRIDLLLDRTSWGKEISRMRIYVAQKK